ncbi:unnamed protein product, partial [Amoebophrya sp. A120]
LKDISGLRSTWDDTLQHKLVLSEAIFPYSPFYFSSNKMLSSSSSGISLARTRSVNSTGVVDHLDAVMQTDTGAGAHTQQSHFNERNETTSGGVGGMEQRTSSSPVPKINAEGEHAPLPSSTNVDSTMDDVVEMGQDENKENGPADVVPSASSVSAYETNEKGSDVVFHDADVDHQVDNNENNFPGNVDTASVGNLSQKSHLEDPCNAKNNPSGQQSLSQSAAESAELDPWRAFRRDVDELTSSSSLHPNFSDSLSAKNWLSLARNTRIMNSRNMRKYLRNKRRLMTPAPGGSSAAGVGPHQHGSWNNATSSTRILPSNVERVTNFHAGVNFPLGSPPPSNAVSSTFSGGGTTNGSIIHGLHQNTGGGGGQHGATTTTSIPAAHNSLAAALQHQQQLSSGGGASAASNAPPSALFPLAREFLSPGSGSISPVPGGMNANNSTGNNSNNLHHLHGGDSHSSSHHTGQHQHAGAANPDLLSRLMEDAFAGRASKSGGSKKPAKKIPLLHGPPPGLAANFSQHSSASAGLI